MRNGLGQTADVLRHPCFYAQAKGRFGRIHLPVAPGCNITCAYCRQEHACPHENRPGVTTAVLSPQAAVAHFQEAMAAVPNLSVAGIAGPGDAFCHPQRTLATFEGIRRLDSQVSLCVSTNGLNVSDSIPDLRDLDVRFVTITVNAIDAAIGARIVKSVRVEGTEIRGPAAAQLLLERQEEALRQLTENGFVVKVNAVLVPGVNDTHLPFVARRMAELKVDLMNILPLIPLPGTDMAHIPKPDHETVRFIRAYAGRYLPQMTHCTRCRADAVGLLGDKGCGARATKSRRSS